MNSEIPIARYISGPFSLRIIHKYPKIFYIFGEFHNKGICESKYHMTITEYMTQMLRQQQIPIDFFLEIDAQRGPFETIYDPDSDIYELYRLVYSCVPLHERNRRRSPDCNIGINRVHWTDIRNQFQTFYPARTHADYDQRMRALNSVNNLFYKQIRKLNNEDDIQFLIDEYDDEYERIIEFYRRESREGPQDMSQRQNMLLFSHMMDFYTVARMLNPQYTNIIFYGGEEHAENISNILLHLGGMLIDEIVEEEEDCLDMLDIRQPFFLS